MPNLCTTFPFSFPVSSPTESCSLPSWLISGQHQFHNVNASHTFHFNSPATSLTVTSSDDVGGGARKYKCAVLEEADQDRLYVRAVAQLSYEW